MVDFYSGLALVVGLGFVTAFASSHAMRHLDRHKDLFFNIQLLLMLVLGLQLFLEGLKPGFNSFLALGLGAFAAFAVSKALTKLGRARSVSERLGRLAVLSLLFVEVVVGTALGAAFASSLAYGVTIAALAGALSIPRNALLALSLSGREEGNLFRTAFSEAVFLVLASSVSFYLLALSSSAVTGAVLAFASGAVLWLAHQEYSARKK